MDQIQDHNLLDLEVTEETKSNLTTLSLWMTITAITGLSSAALSFISTIRAILRLSKYGFYSSYPIMTLFMSVVTIGLSLVLNIILINAANSLKKGLLSSDQHSINSGTGKLASYLKITGIVIICTLVFVVLFFIYGVIMSATRDFGR